MKIILLLLVTVATFSRAAEPQVRDMPAGFCVQLGCGDGAFTTELAADGRLAVHALEADAQNVEHVRERLQARDLYGTAVVEQWSAPFLPYADNLVNVLIAENPGKITKTELLRVVAPHGTLWLKRDGAWEATRKPWPREFDEWTHWRHDADGNMVSHDTAVTLPTGLRWIAGPVQDAGGRKWYYDHVLVSSAGRNFYQFDSEIVARDAFNGRLLWRRPAKAQTFTETGVPGGLKLGTRISKVKPVAEICRLYAVIDDQLIVLDAATGTLVRNYCAVTAPREIVVTDNLIFVSDKNGVRAFAAGGNLCWQWNGVARRLIAADGTLFCLGTNEVVALTLASGKERWHAAHERVAEAMTCSYGSGVLALECSAFRDDGTGAGIVVLAGDTGAVLWTRNYIPGMTHYKEARTFFANGLLWVEEQTSKKPMTIKVLGLDPRTGAQRKAVGTRGLHCSTPVATDRYFIAPEMEFTDWKTGKQTTGRMARHSCRLPFVPANGLLNTFPLQCECYPILRGYMGLAQTLPARDPGTPRLQKGPAFDSPHTTDHSPTDWPIYRHDTFRSGATPVALTGTDLQPLWNVQIAPPSTNSLTAEWRDNPFVRGTVTAPVCVGDTVLLAVPDRHRVVALNAATGKVRWNFTAGGRVDTPPTIADGRCVFGAHDGYVYCVNLADGQLAWRFRAAPSEARIAVYGQMESPWPVAGSVLIDAGVVYFAAGRHPASDGGVRVAAVRVNDGKLVWEQTVTDMGVKVWYSGMLPGAKQKIGVDYEPVDLIVRDGECVAMSRWRFEPKTGAMKLSVTSTNYNASGLSVPRGAWGYGIRQTKQVLDKPPTVFDAGKVTVSRTNAVAAVLAGTTLVTGNATGELKIAGQKIPLGVPLLRDGLIAAAGRLYAATQDGCLICLGKR